jgi:hypothetical protein
MKRFQIALVVAAVAGFALGSAATSIAARAEADVTACGLLRGTPVIASFQVSDGKGIWQRLPALGRSPELEEATGPATVLVLGDVDPPAMVGGFGQAPPPQLPNAVCVILSDGPLLYYNVSRQGFRAQ